MKFKHKIITTRVLPKSATKYVRLGLAGVFLAFSVVPVYGLLSNPSVSLKHADVEAGVFCNIQYGGLLESLECYKNDNIGLELTEVDLSPKFWEYNINGETDILIVERKGYSGGLEFSVRGNMLKRQKTVKIAYPED